MNAVYVMQDGVEVRPDVCQGFVIQKEDVAADSRSARVAVVHGAPARFVVWDWSKGGPIENLFLMGGAVLPKRVTMLEDHGSYSTRNIRGSATDFVVSGNRLLATLSWAMDPDSEASWLKARDGHLTAVSIGAIVTKFVYVEPGESLELDGVTYKAGELPLRINQSWGPKEVSLVVFGADPEAGVLGKHGAICGAVGQAEEAGASKASALPSGSLVTSGAGSLVTSGTGGQGGNNIRSVAMSWLKKVLVQMGLVAADADAAAVEQARAQLSAEQAAAVNAAVAVAQAAASEAGAGSTATPSGSPSEVPPVGVNQAASNQGASSAAPLNVVSLDAAREEGRMAEQARMRGIREASNGLGLEETVIQSAIDEGLSVEQAHVRFLTTLRASRTAAAGGNLHINTGAGRQGMTVQTLAAGLALTMGCEWIDPRAPESVRQEQTRLLEQGDAFRGMGLLDLARQSILLDGAHPEVGRTAMVQQAFSGASLSNALSNTIGRVIMANFERAYDSTVGVFFEEDLPDYKLVDRVVVSQQEQLDALPSGGTAKHASVTDDKEQYQVTRFAKQFVVDDMTVINDDIGAIQRTLLNIGLAAARTRPDFVYAVLNSNPAMRDSVDLFHADHANTTTGAMAASTLKVAIAKMTKQYELVGKEKIPLNLRPKWLLVPSDLEFTARELLKSSGRDAADGNGDKNVLAELGIQLRVDDRLGVNGALHPITKTVQVGTATNYYLAAGMEVPTISIGYLQGMNRRPSMRRFTLDRGQYGVGMDIQHVLGVKAMDWKGLVKSTGA